MNFVQAKIHGLIGKWYHSIYNKKHQVHICNECGKIGKKFRRIHVTGLIIYLFIGSYLFFTWKWWIGILFFYFAMTLHSYIAKPVCRHCFSTNIRYPTKEEYEEYKKEKDKKGIQKEKSY